MLSKGVFSFLNVHAEVKILHKNKQDTVWLVYDGQCPLCSATAHAMKIREAVGTLRIINAREPHPIMEEINEAGLNIDEGMVVKFQDQFYHGADAQHILAIIGTNQDWFNRLNVILFRSKFLAKFLYPMLKAQRNMILRMKGITKINHLSQRPIFKSVFGEHWQKLPVVFLKHYAIRPYSKDHISFVGKMNFDTVGMMKYLFPLFRLLKILVPYAGNDIPTVINLHGDLHSSYFYFDRTFQFPNRDPYHFNSYSIPIKNNLVVEIMLLGIGWRCAYVVVANKIILKHAGYTLKLFGLFLPLPLTFILGRVDFEKEAISDHAFKLKMELNHFLFGKYSYTGELKILNSSPNSEDKKSQVR